MCPFSNYAVSDCYTVMSNDETAGMPLIHVLWYRLIVQLVTSQHNMYLDIHKSRAV